MRARGSLHWNFRAGVFKACIDEGRLDGLIYRRHVGSSADVSVAVFLCLSLLTIHYSPGMSPQKAESRGNNCGRGIRQPQRQEYSSRVGSLVQE